MLRNRDIVGILLAVFLTRVAWQENGGIIGGDGDDDAGVQASIHLAFYYPRQNGRERTSVEVGPALSSAALLDLDGNGNAEAIALLNFQSDEPEPEQNAAQLKHQSHAIRNQRKGKYTISVLDLYHHSQQSSASSITAAAPFKPRVLFQSKPIDLDPPNEHASHEVFPLALSTGQVVFDPDTLAGSMSSSAAASSSGSGSSSKTEDGILINERTRRYFCGTDWHDAAQNCKKPCPGGQLHECDGDERCFADTPCDYDEYMAKQNKGGKNQKTDVNKMHMTLAGGWPSIWTFWSNGQVTMHALTGEKQEDDTSNSTIPKKTPSYRSKKSKTDASSMIDLRLVWTVQPVVNRTMVDWEDMRVTYVDAISTGMGHGMVLLSGMVDWEIYHPPGTYHDQGDEEDVEDWSSSFVMALHDQTGQTLWQSFDEVEDELDLPPAVDLFTGLDFTRGATSYARRRSLIPNLHPLDEEQATGSLVPNCMNTYRQSLLRSEVLPTFYQVPEDATVKIIHLEQQHHKQQQQGTDKRTPAGGAGGTVVKSKAKASGGGGSSKKERRATTTTSSGSGGGGGGGGWASSLFSSQKKQQQQPSKHHHHHHHHHGKRRNDLSQAGRPNAIATHHFDGVQVRSLKNGRSLCHLTLWENTMYLDINRDGILDSVQFITGRRRVRDEEDTDDADQWMVRLVKRVSEGGSSGSNETSASGNKMAGRFGIQGGNSNWGALSGNMCHIMALSGMPTKEELFSGSICGHHRYAKQQQQQQQQQAGVDDLEAAAPLAVESQRYSSSKRRLQGWDIISVLNNGVMNRFRGSSGRRLWQVQGKQQDDEFPTWHNPHAVLLSRIESDVLWTAAQRPVVLAGENSVALISPRTGNILGLATFPQPAADNRPILGDWNGDGTTDLMVITADAIWGYQVHVSTRPAILLRILVGILFAGMLLALLRNRFGPHPGKRSTDA